MRGDPRHSLGGVFVFCGIASALYAREKTGKGCHVDVAMFDGTFAFLEQGLMAYSATGESPKRLGNRHPYMTPFDTFEAADTQFVIYCAMITCLASCAAPSADRKPSTRERVERREGTPVNLACRIHRQLGNDPDHLRHLEGGEPLSAVRAQSLRVGVALQHHSRFDLLAILWVRCPEGRCARDRGVCQQHLLDLPLAAATASGRC
jgi:hypothetical protein